jgi:hypothetical protein
VKEPELPVTARSKTQLAHGWQLSASQDVPKALIREYIRPAVRAVPSEMARQMGMCRFSLVAELPDPDLTSQWTAIGQELEILVATRNRDDHDTAMELLVCLGQILWESLTPDQVRAYWQLLYAEFQTGIEGEIDDEAFARKRMLLRNRLSARSRTRLQQYARSSFAETAAEFVHCLWHDVNVVSGSEHLPSRQLQRRLELLSRWFPPNRGYTLYSRT